MDVIGARVASFTLARLTEVPAREQICDDFAGLRLRGEQTIADGRKRETFHNETDSLEMKSLSGIVDQRK